MMNSACMRTLIYAFSRTPLNRYPHNALGCPDAGHGFVFYMSPILSRLPIGGALHITIRVAIRQGGARDVQGGYPLIWVILGVV